MKRFIATSLTALALVVSAAGAAPAAHAQYGDIGGTNSVTGTNEATPGTTAAGCLEDPGDPGVFYDADTGEICTGAAKSALSTGDPAAAKTPNTLPPKLDVKSGLNGVMAYIVQLFAWLLGVAVILLDYAVFYTVVKMGSYVNSLSAVGVTWRIVRDIGNIMLIFGFLSVGITTILNVEWYGVGKKMLPGLFVAAVFLNFSLFIAEAIVDTGNLFATQFYTQINGGVPAGGKVPPAGVLSGINNEGISNKIMSNLGLLTIYGAAKNPASAAKLFEENTFTIGFMSIILFLVAAFVFFSLAFVLIFRFVALVFLIIAAPLGFAGLAIPGFANLQKKWWTHIFEQTITAPILLLMLYIALAVITDAAFLTGMSSCTLIPGSTTSCSEQLDFAAYVSGNLGGFISVILSFLVAMGLLLLVVVYAKRWSAFGGDFASRMGAKLSFGLTAAGMRYTAGAGLNAFARRFRNSKYVRIPVVGRTFAGVLDRGAKASFDVRGTGVLKKIPLGSQIDAGEAQKGGYRKIEEEAIKAREKHAELLKQTSEEKKEQALWETRLAQQNRVHEEELRNMDAEQRAERQPHEEEIKAQRAKVAELRAKANRTKSDADKAGLAAEELTLSNQVKELDELRTKQQDVRKQLEKLQQETITNITDKIKEIKRVPQEGYAKNLEMMPWGVLYKNSKAAENIRRDAGKSKEQKDVEKVLELAKKYAAAEPGAAQPPTPTPPASGGTTP